MRTVLLSMVLAALACGTRPQAPTASPGPPLDPNPGEAWQAPAAGALVWVPGATFAMGSPDHEPGRGPNEGPVHEVTVEGLWVLRAEVSQGLYERVMGERPSGFAGCLDCPVDQVSWFDAVAFANALSEMEGLSPAYSGGDPTVSWDRSADGYRLLTEAEWEHAARGGQPFRHAGSNDPTAIGWVRANEGEHPHPSCEKPPNGFGLCDLTGNLREWVWDWAAPYGEGPQSNPTGPAEGHYRGIRGGSWWAEPWQARVAYRFSQPPRYRSMSLGIRLGRPASGR